MQNLCLDPEFVRDPGLAPVRIRSCWANNRKSPTPENGAFEVPGGH